MNRAAGIPRGASPEVQRWAEQLQRPPVVVTVDASYDMRATDDVVLADATSGAVTVKLPRPEDVKGVTLIVKKLDASANAVTVDGNGGTIDGASSATLASQYDALMVVSDGTDWSVVADMTATEAFDPGLVVVTATHTMTADERIVVVNNGGVNVTINLPDPATVLGIPLTVKKTGFGTVTLDAPGLATIDGAATVALTSNARQSRTVVSDGTNYHIIASVD